MSSSIYPPVRILICAADLLARAGLAALLADQAELTVVGQIVPTDDFMAALALYQPDLVLWDLGWSTGEELEEAVDQLGDSISVSLPTLVLIANADDAITLWSAGVKGILLRDVEPTTLIAALIALAHNLTVFDNTLPLLTTDAWMPSGTETLVEPLTARELEVLQVMAQGLSNKLIARQLDISEHTVKFHINAILGKLGAQSRTEAVVRATRAGLIRL